MGNSIPRINLTIKKKPPKHKKKIVPKPKPPVEAVKDCPVKIKLDIEGI
jgi:hypothetical protein